MKIYVCIKQVPNTTKINIDVEKGILIRDNINNIINPSDKNALEVALKIKDQNPRTEIIVISMGPIQAIDVINESLALGADKGFLLSDRCFSGSDTYVTSKILSEAIKYIGYPDLILTGKQALDGETAQVGPQLAEKLNIDFETSIDDVKYVNKKLQVIKETDDKKIKIEMNFPCLLTINKDINIPRNITAYNIVNLKDKFVQILDHNDLNLSLQDCGLDASPTKVVETFLLPKNKGCSFIEEQIEDTIIKIINSI